MSIDFVSIPVEYLVSTTSDWTTFQIVEGGWWSDMKVVCLHALTFLSRILSIKLMDFGSLPRITSRIISESR